MGFCGPFCIIEFYFILFYNINDNYWTSGREKNKKNKKKKAK